MFTCLVIIIRVLSLMLNMNISLMSLNVLLTQLYVTLLLFAEILIPVLIVIIVRLGV